MTCSYYYKIACCSNMQVGLSLFQSGRFERSAVIGLHVTHARTARTVLPFYPNAIVRLWPSAIDSAMIILVLR